MGKQNPFKAYLKRMGDDRDYEFFCLDRDGNNGIRDPYEVAHNLAHNWNMMHGSDEGALYQVSRLTNEQTFSSMALDSVVMKLNGFKRRIDKGVDSGEIFDHCAFSQVEGAYIDAEDAIARLETRKIGAKEYNNWMSIDYIDFVKGARTMELI